MRTKTSILLLLAILVAFTAACRLTSSLTPNTPAENSAPGRTQDPVDTQGLNAVPTTSQPSYTPVSLIKTPGSGVAPKNTMDDLLEHALALKSVRVSLVTTNPEGATTQVEAEIDVSGNQHIVKTYPDSQLASLTGSQVETLRKSELYIIQGTAYAPTDGEQLAKSELGELAFQLEQILKSPAGPGLWLKILPAGSLTRAGREEMNGFQTERYQVEGSLEGSTITGAIWVDPSRQALVAAELDVPAALSALSRQASGSLRISFTVSQAQIAPIQIDPARIKP